MTRPIPYKAKKSEVVGDGEKAISFENSNKPRMFSDNKKQKKL